MIRSLRRPLHATLALGLLGTLSLPAAWAVGTAAGTTINNRATVNYTVGTVAQSPIESSPTGNTTPGAGNGGDTGFVVDNRIDLTLTAVPPATLVNPGATDRVVAYTLTNTGNAPQAYTFTAANLTGGAVFGNTDNQDVNTLRVFVDNPTSGTVGSYDAADTATSIATLAADASIRVFVLANVPLTAINGQFANVRLTARTDVNGSPGTAATQTTGANTAGVDVVFGDGGTGGQVARDAQAFADHQYAVQSAALTVAKTSAIISDPFNGTTDPKATPGASIEYVLTVTNTGTLAATGVVITDPVPTNTTFQPLQYSSGTRDVQIQVGAGAPTFCIAEAGSDTNADGCFRTAGGVLTVQSPALAAGGIATGAANAVTVRFRVTVN